MAERDGAGRPSKLTPEVQAKIIQAISSGNTRKTSAAYAGIGERTLMTWLAHKGPQYVQFQQAIEKAEAEAVVVSVLTIRSAARDSWQAAAWWLERRYPDEWGRKDRVTIEAMLKTESEKIAKELGLSVEEVMAGAEAILQGSN